MPKSRFDIAVTKDDIERAFQSNSAKCVVAQAIARTLPDAHHIEVDIQTIRFTRGDERFAYLTPYSVAGYVIGFDAGDEVHPFRFRLYDAQRVEIRRRTTTGPKAKVDRTAAKARYSQQKADAAQAKLDMTLGAMDGKLTDPTLPPPTPDEVKRVRAEAQAAKLAAKDAAVKLAAAKDAAKGSPSTTALPVTGDVPARKLPRAFKTNKRTYGGRVHRINQAAE